MKKILIAGKDSYVGLNCKSYLEYFPDDFYVEELDVRGNDWESHDFSQFDVVYHVAGLAHSTPKESQKDSYYRVNTELAYKVCLKAKKSGVKQFIFMSSIIVYGSGDSGKNRVITKDTLLMPDNYYGDSKKQAEQRISNLYEENFRIVIIRSPMIYGPGSKGNYSMLSKFAKLTPFFPSLENERSMLFIGNLMEFVKLMIEHEENGIFLPQNIEYVSTKRIVKEISYLYNHKIFFIKVFNPFISVCKKNIYINKLFGSLTISRDLSDYKINYNKFSFSDSIKITEGFEL